MLNRPRVLAHPLTDPFQLPVSPLVSAWLATALVLIVALAWPAAAERGRLEPLGRDVCSWAGSLSPAQWLTRALAVAALATAVAAARLGTNDDLENLAPALIVGAGWPLLVLVSILAGPIWRWLDPWDALARVLVRDETGEPAPDVRPAALVALPWVWYLSAYPDTLEPRSIGTMLALYTVLTVAGCLAVGRRRWLSAAEPLGIVLGWMALLPQRRLVGWEPPRGAEALLGVLAGGVLFGAVRRSELWGELNIADDALLWATLAVIASCAVAVGLVAGAAEITRIEDARAGAAAARAAVPAVAGIVLAVAMDSNRLTTSMQLLPGLAGDPFGLGWDLFGAAGAGLDAQPFGVRGLLASQVAVLVVGHVVGAIVLARAAGRVARVPTAVVLAILANLSVLAVASH
jgi:hypothetical protein